MQQPLARALQRALLRPLAAATAPAAPLSTAANAAGDSDEIKWVFLGPPGVGKGTYASRIAQHLGVPHIAAGDLVRAEIKSGSELGEQVRCTGRRTRHPWKRPAPDAALCRGRPARAVPVRANPT
jgi:replication-associated recombination protein RarA